MRASSPPREGVLPRSRLSALFQALQEWGYEIIGPQIRDQAIVYDVLDRAEDLAAGYREEHAPGRYRLTPRAQQKVFASTASIHAWKRFLYPPEIKLYQISLNSSQAQIESLATPVRKRAFLGVRPCDLHAIAVQDRIFTGGVYRDPYYEANRAATLLIAVNCDEPGATCFCGSMGSGPSATHGFDLLLTEILEPEHRFLIESGSAAGEAILSRLPVTPPQEEDRTAAQDLHRQACQKFQRFVDTNELRELMYAQAESEHWEKVARRCFACANCTQVCPTCFCVNFEDSSDVSGATAQRWRRWDSCFHLSFSYIHGGSVRTSVGARYRQWITHKLASWWDQFGTSGCVGCGRCVTWCPAAIDITAEAKALGTLTRSERAHAST
ncbi:MAG: 4Fe-4S dicluster domain-containing protein [Bryobacteraceae bacterium]|nr:4Fe-4S dicluster domain-containing protein [Bryobacteraceae bacterium]MDW8379766.1 4Fe-4S dicluster domain-containing protein [Bryobacterales bacterium]